MKWSLHNDARIIRRRCIRISVYPAHLCRTLVPTARDSFHNVQSSGSDKLHLAHFLSNSFTVKMPKCPTCTKEVYFAEKVTSLGKDWHRACLRCAKCKKTLTPGGHAENSGNAYCHKPCYATLFGPSGTNSHSHAEYTGQPRR